MNLVKFHRNPTFMPSNTLFPSVFDDFFGKHIGEFAGVDFASNIPSVNISEADSGFQIEVAAPGLTKEDFKISLDKDRLTISTEKTMDEETKDGKWVRREFNFSTFSRSFVLPKTVDKNKIDATYVNGVLVLNVPKKPEIVEEQKTRMIEIH